MLPFSYKDFVKSIILWKLKPAVFCYYIVALLITLGYYLGFFLLNYSALFFVWIFLPFFLVGGVIIGSHFSMTLPSIRQYIYLGAIITVNVLIFILLLLLVFTVHNFNHTFPTWVESLDYYHVFLINILYTLPYIIHAAYRLEKDWRIWEPPWIVSDSFIYTGLQR